MMLALVLAAAAVIPSIDPDTAVVREAAGAHYVLVDVRSPQAYAQEHLPEAVSLPVDALDRLATETAAPRPVGAARGADGMSRIDPSTGFLLRSLRVLDDVRDLAWMDQGRCAETDPESFFPEKGGSTLAAKKVCAACEVREECLAYALAHSGPEDIGWWGVWGGKSAQERQIMLGRRRKDAA